MSIAKHTKDIIITSLKENHFDISSACEEVGLTLAQFDSCRSDEKFLEGLAEARQIRDDMASSKFMSLIKTGHAGATIEYQKMLRQSDDKNEALNIRKKTMRLLINNSETKAAAFREFSDIFSESAKACEKYFQISMTEFNLLSPAERIKKEKSESSDAMSKLFESGNLPEIEMYKKMMIIALHDAENSEFPSERSRAMDKVIDINRRLDEIQERLRREAEEDEDNLFDKLDASLAGTTPKEIKKLRIKLLSGIEDKNAS